MPLLRESLKRPLTSNRSQKLRQQRHRIKVPISVLRARRTANLDVLARYYGTDKSSQTHGYTRLYEQHFRRRRVGVRSVLEIGVGGVTSGTGYETTTGGQSLRMWRDYFPDDELVGIDFNNKEISCRRVELN